MELAALQKLAHPLATRGVVPAAVLRLAGADPDAVKCALRNGWVAELPGLYVIDGRPSDPLVKAQLATEFAGPGFVVTGLLACRWYDLRWVPDTHVVQVLVDPERRRRGSRGFVLVRRCATIASLPTASYEGIPVAPLAHAVVDGTRELTSL